MTIRPFLLAVFLSGLIWMDGPAQQRCDPLWEARDDHLAFCLDLREQTRSDLNICGIPSMPFPRLAVRDFNGDGSTELVICGKGWDLSLYTSPDGRRWELQSGYFRGVAGGTFLAPATGDLDGDGKPELVVGTGGFSSYSGRIICYRNTGSLMQPRWEEVDCGEPDVGDDAAPALADWDGDGRLDLIAGNSEGKLFFFRNRGDGRFSLAPAPAGLPSSFGMYAVPAVLPMPGYLLLAVGNDQGRVFLFRLQAGRPAPQVLAYPGFKAVRSFAAPAFGVIGTRSGLGMVVGDGDGALSYYSAQAAAPATWKKSETLFQNRLHAGLASSPSAAVRPQGLALVTGNIDGTLRLFEPSGMNTWGQYRERPGYFAGVRIAGYARALLTYWNGKELLISGQGDGRFRAFANRGKPGAPLWVEWNGFFAGVRVSGNSTPCVFDLDGDGTWELISGAQDGRLSVFRAVRLRKGTPEWEPWPHPMQQIRTGGYSVPSLADWYGALFLCLGERSGRVRIFRLGRDPEDPESIAEFSGDIIQLASFSSPWCVASSAGLEILAGDYDGNLRHFLAHPVIYWDEAWLNRPVIFPR